MDRKEGRQAGVLEDRIESQMCAERGQERVLDAEWKRGRRGKKKAEIDEEEDGRSER